MLVVSTEIWGYDLLFALSWAAPLLAANLGCASRRPYAPPRGPGDRKKSCCP